jgi:hypothetical protein
MYELGNKILPLFPTLSPRFAENGGKPAQYDATAPHPLSALL